MKVKTKNVLWIITILILIGFPYASHSQDYASEKSKAAHLRQKNRLMTKSVLSSNGPSNQFIEIEISDNGQFTIGTTGGDPDNPNDNNQDLLYGHPGNSSGSDFGPGTSATTIRIEGIDYWNYDRSVIGAIVEPPTNSGNSNTTTWEVDNFRVTQTLTIVSGTTSGNADAVEIKYTIKNMSGSSKQIGIRLMLDTMLGENDGAPFKIPGVGDVTKEREFLKDNMPLFWQAFDDLINPTIQAQGTLIGGNATKPDRFIAVGWGNINDTPWEYTVQTGRDIDDSAVGIYWYEIELAPSASHDFVTYYGLGGIDVDIRPPLVVGLTAPTSVIAIKDKPADPFKLIVYLSNTSPGVNQTATGISTELRLPSGLSLASGQPVHNIDTLAVGADTQTDYSILADGSVGGKLTYSVDVTSANIDSKTVSKDVYVFGIKTTPTDGAEVETSSTISATFNVDMDAASFTVSSFLLFDGANFVNGNVNYDPGERTASFVPDSLEAGKQYTAILTTDVKSADGEPLPYSAEWIFSISTSPFIQNLLPQNGARLGSNDVTFTWESLESASSEIFLRAEGETEFTPYTGEDGLAHTVSVPGLERNKTYVYYARSEVAGNAYSSEQRSFYVDNGIAFTQDIYAPPEIERDYNQLVRIEVQNTDDELHKLLTQIINPYEDLIVGFVGDGSVDKIIPLSSGESQEVVLAVHAQDAELKNYELSARITSDAGTAEELTDIARIRIRVRQPNVNFTLVRTSSDPVTLVNTYKITNHGDPLTDLDVLPDDNIKDHSIIYPNIEHAKLESGQSIEFQVGPFFSQTSPPSLSGTIKAIAGKGTYLERTEEANVEFACTNGTIRKATLNNVMLNARTKSWYCTNRPRIDVAFLMPGGIESISEAVVNISFDPSKSWHHKEHDVHILINGIEIDALTNTIPSGLFPFKIPDPMNTLIFPDVGGVATNTITLKTEHMNGGHYVVASEFETHICIDQMELWVCTPQGKTPEEVAREVYKDLLIDIPTDVNIAFDAPSENDEIPLGLPYNIQVSLSSKNMAIPLTASFSNGDADIPMVSLGDGKYEAEWTPQNQGDAKGNCEITVMSSSEYEVCGVHIDVKEAKRLVKLKETSGSECMILQKMNKYFDFYDEKPVKDSLPFPVESKKTPVTDPALVEDDDLWVVEVYPVVVSFMQEGINFEIDSNDWYEGEDFKIDFSDVVSEELAEFLALWFGFDYQFGPAIAIGKDLECPDEEIWSELQISTTIPLFVPSPPTFTGTGYLKLFYNEEIEDIDVEFGEHIDIEGSLPLQSISKKYVFQEIIDFIGWKVELKVEIELHFSPSVKFASKLKTPTSTGRIPDIIPNSTVIAAEVMVEANGTVTVTVGDHNLSSDLSGDLIILGEVALSSYDFESDETIVSPLYDITYSALKENSPFLYMSSRLFLPGIPGGFDSFCLDYDYGDGAVESSLSCESQQNTSLGIAAISPVDLRLVDPDGLQIDLQANEISDALYAEMDIDNDNEDDDVILILRRKMGTYKIYVLAEDNASPTDTYTLKLNYADTTLVLAENIPISNIPDEPYIFESGPSVAPSMPAHWNFIANTGNDATIVLPTDANPNIDGVALASGDYIGVFTPDGLCCGHAQWQGQNMAITVWGDDDQTTGIDGFQSGELLSYRVYRAGEDKEWTTVVVDYSQGTGDYAADAFMVLSRFDVFDVRTITLNFTQGWNMFSINVNPTDRSIEAIMAPIVDNLLIMKNDDGETYIPAFGIDDIGNIDFKEGYQANLSQTVTLDVTGQPVNPGTPISLTSGWSMIGYLPAVPINAATALASIRDQLVIAKNNAGQAYIPEFDINDIGEMQPGQGYQVYLDSDATLIYPSSSRLTKAVTPAVDTEQKSLKKTLTEHFKFTGNTGENAIVVVPTHAEPKYTDGTPLENGDEIGVFTSAGLCCGAVVWEGANVAITVWGDNSQTDSLDGFQAGDTLRFRVWEKSADVEYSANVSYRPGDPLVYKANGLSVLTELVADLTTDVAEMREPSVPSDFKLNQNYPNPFNAGTTIEYLLPQMSEVVLVIYDLQGHAVRRLVHETKLAGSYQAHWDGRDELGHAVASGVYFYRIEVKAKDVGGYSFVDIKKMVLMR